MTPEVESVLTEHGAATRDALIPLLQDVQERCGYISEDAVEQIAHHLDIAPSKVYGVATFYNQFRFTPPGRFHIQVCRGTACHVKGSKKLLEAIERELQITTGQTTKDGQFSLEVVACMGACGLAPAMNVGGKMHAKVKPDSVKTLLDEYRGKGNAK